MVRAIMIVEIAGRPAEHVRTSLENHAKILNDVKDVEVHTIKVSDPKEIEIDQKAEGVPAGGPMFTCFAELDFETRNFARLSEIMFDFMPSSIEVIEPANVSMNIEEATSLLNNLSGRLHRYDEIAKIAQMRNQQMMGRMEQMQEILKKEAEKKKTAEDDAKKEKKKAVKKKVTKKGTKKKAVKKKASKKK
jgi:hypothetical protein